MEHHLSGHEQRTSPRFFSWRFEGRRLAAACGVGCTLVFCAVICAFSSGCSRHFYRQKADHEAYGLVGAAASDSRWGLHDYTLTPSVASRHFDPACPDHEPMPCDDPTAHRLMHCVDGKKQRKCRFCAMASLSENPRWREYLNVAADGSVLLDRETAVTLALRHSPDYQTQLEKVYLAALDVSQERFRYDVQFFGGDSIYYNTNGSLRNNGNNNWANNFTASAEKKGAMGGEWVVSVANSITWNLTGPDRFDSSSLISLNVVQPLLRGAGRAIVLESLTQTERDLLAGLRQLAFFRQWFYSRVVTGSGGVAGGGSGYYALLQEQVRLRHQGNNIDGIDDNLQRMQQLFDAGKRIRALQLEQTRAQLLTSQSSLVGQQARYATLVETYLRSLGLPPDLKVDVRDDVLEQFHLIPETVRVHEKQLADLVASVRAADDPATLVPQILAATQASQREMKATWHDLSFLEQRRDARIQGLQSLAAQLASDEGEKKIDQGIVSADAFRRAVASTRDRIARHDKMVQAITTLVSLTSRQSKESMTRMLRLRSFDESADAAIKLLAFKGGIGDETTLAIVQETESADAARQGDDLYRAWMVRLASRLHAEMSEVALWRARTRLDAITLTPTELNLPAALAAAEANRLDWMNRRSEMVDKWRAIQIAADRLRGDLSVKVSGDAGTIGGNGIKFDAKNSSLKVGLEWDSPLTRHNEMLNYRRAQIAYQQSRRDYNTFVDTVAAELRDTHRLLLSHQLNFEVQRAAIGVAIIETTLAQLELERPQSGGSYNTNLANDIVNSLQRLLNAQNAFIEIWFSYETQRLLLALRTGTMTLDDRGI